MNGPNLDDVTTFLPLFARSVAFMQTAPFLGDTYLTVRFRVVASALFALAILPVWPRVSMEALPLALAANLFIGMTAGFIGKLVIAGAEAGGQLIGLELELGFAGIFDPNSAEETLPTRRLANALAGMAFLAADGVGSVVRLLASGSVDGRSPQLALQSVVQHGGEVLETAMRIAAPTVVSCMVAHLTVAVANRAAPALNVFSVALALVLVAGGITLVATAPVLVREMLAIGRTAAESVGGVR